MELIIVVNILCEIKTLLSDALKNIKPIVLILCVFLGTTGCIGYDPIYTPKYQSLSQSEKEEYFRCAEYVSNTMCHKSQLITTCNHYSYMSFCATHEDKDAISSAYCARELFGKRYLDASTRIDKEHVLKVFKCL